MSNRKGSNQRVLSHAVGHEAEVKERPSFLPTRPSVCRNSFDLGGGIYSWRHFCISVSIGAIHLFSSSHTEKHTSRHKTYKHTTFFPEQISLRRSMTEVPNKSPQHHYNHYCYIESFKFNKGPIVCQSSLQPHLMTHSHMP